MAECIEWYRDEIARSVLRSSDLDTLRKVAELLGVGEKEAGNG